MRFGNQVLYNLDFYREWQEIGQGFVQLVLSDPPNGSQSKQYPTDEKPDYANFGWIIHQLLDFCGAIALIHPPKLTSEIEVDFRKYFKLTYQEFWHKPSAMAKIKDRPRPDIDVVSIYHRHGSAIKDHVFNWESIAEVKNPYVRRNKNLKNSTMTTQKRRLDVNPSGRRYPSSLVEVVNRPAMTNAEKEGINHPFQKSLSAVTRLVRMLSNPGDLILDPFAGSGTTMVAAEKTGRRSIGYEIDESNYLEAEARLAKEVGRGEQVFLDDG